MSLGEVYGKELDKRPELVVHERLRDSGKIRELVRKASKMNWQVKFESGVFRQDMIVNFNDDDGSRPQHLSYAAGKRLFDALESKNYLY